MKGRILVIDDEQIVRTSCRRTLVPEDFEVLFAENGPSALSTMAETQIDLVLTDLKMPEMDGIEVLRKIKERWPQTEVVIMTGYQTVETAVQSIKLGAYDYIEKPFTPDVLLNAVRKAMDHKERLKGQSGNA